jgi:glycosyltransferase involved in cell wall biosynthesis
MRILYITPIIKGEGGVQKILSIKTNYFIDNFNYQIDILSKNDENDNLLFDYNKEIGFYDLSLKGNKISTLFQYKKQLQNCIKLVNPDCIIVCDFGLKGFLIPFLIHTKKPVIFEAHGSLYNESKYYKVTFFSKLAHNLKYLYRIFCAKRFDLFIALSKESLKEWNLKKGVVIPNSVVVNNNLFAPLISKKVIVVARHSYEKGIDRILQVWKIVSQKHIDWELEIYGTEDQSLQLKSLAEALTISDRVRFYDPVKDIENKYLDSAIYAMTSRSEGFPMVLLEAMSYGLPVVAFDCPIGPKSIIINNENGFLIPDGNIELFATKINELIEDVNLRKTIGIAAQKSMEKYNIDTIMKMWNELFTEILKNKKIKFLS